MDVLVEESSKVLAGDIVEGERVLEISAAHIERFVGQPRTYFNPKKMASLKKSIGAIGQQTPILVSKIREKVGKKKRDGNTPFLIIDGERRWRACKSINPNYKMLCIVKIVEDLAEHYELAAIANAQREDLLPIEKARSMKKLKDEHHMSVEQIAQIFDFEEATVYNYIGVLTLPEDILDYLNPEKYPEEKQLQFSIAVQLSRITKRGKPGGEDFARELFADVYDSGMKTPAALPYIAEKAKLRGYEIDDAKVNSRNLRRTFRSWITRTLNSCDRFVGKSADDNLFFKMYGMYEDEEITETDIARTRHLIDLFTTIERELREEDLKKIGQIILKLKEVEKKLEAES